MLVINYLKQLYETDNYQWLEETVKLLKDCQFEAAQPRKFNRGVRRFGE